MLPLSKPAIATNVILVLHLVVEQLPVAADHRRATTDMQTLPLGLARFLSYMEDTTGALYAFVRDGAGAGPVRVPDGAEDFIRGLTAGATKG